MRRATHALLASLPLLALPSGCAEVSTDPLPAGPGIPSMAVPAQQEADPLPYIDPFAAAPQPVEHLVAVMHGTDAAPEVGGEIRLDAAGDSVRVRVDLWGLSPGTHAFHVHAYGDCSAADGSSAGPHYDFDGSWRHPTRSDDIAGNLGQILADASGEVADSLLVRGPRISGETTIVGRSVVIHADANDPSAPPGGDAGARIACGVIGVSDAAP